MAEDPQIWAYTRTTPNGRLLVIANCGRDARTLDIEHEIGREWIAAELVLGNLPDPPVDTTSTFLELAGWDARIYSAGPLTALTHRVASHGDSRTQARSARLPVLRHR
jgi:oligo-1,6-glucosidase